MRRWRWVEPGPDDDSVVVQEMTDAEILRDYYATLEEKVDIVQNAIDLAHALRVETVLVAILSARTRDIAASEDAAKHRQSAAQSGDGSFAAGSGRAP